MFTSQSQAQRSLAKPQAGASALMLPVLVCAAIAVLALAVPRIIGRSTFWIFLPGFFTETVLLLCSLALGAWLTRGRLAAFGFTRGSFRLTPGLLLWVLPMSLIASLQVIGSPPGASAAPRPIGSPVAIVLTIWIYASVCEEIFTRGLLQSWLAPLARYRVRLGGWALSVPVLTSALFFGAMHVVLWPKLGPAALVVMGLAAILGLIAGRYREKTGSLIPAILIHALFDIGGTLPPWIAVWLQRVHV